MTDNFLAILRQTYLFHNIFFLGTPRQGRTPGSLREKMGSLGQGRGLGRTQGEMAPKVRHIFSFSPTLGRSQGTPLRHRLEACATKNHRLEACATNFLKGRTPGSLREKMGSLGQGRGLGRTQGEMPPKVRHIFSFSPTLGRSQGTPLRHRLEACATNFLKGRTPGSPLRKADVRRIVSRTAPGRTPGNRLKTDFFSPCASAKGIGI